MKKLLTLFLAAVMCLSLAACGKPKVESCVLNANTMVSGHTPHTEAVYKFDAEYLEDENAYVIMMSIDKERLEEVLADTNQDYVEILRAMSIENLDSDTETISFELQAIQDSVEPLFEDTDVEVVSGYVDYEGNVTRYN